jgi:hypothetical protein
MWVHRLSEINPQSRIAQCSNCGQVRITRKGGGYRCGTAAYLQDARRKYGEYIHKRLKTCEVCGSGVRIVYDHSHITGEFRGWLCNACNVALGLVRDDPIVLRKLAHYLEARKSKS